VRTHRPVRRNKNNPLFSMGYFMSVAKSVANEFFCALAPVIKKNKNSVDNNFFTLYTF
jgi:hypothetical protein